MCKSIDELYDDAYDFDDDDDDLPEHEIEADNLAYELVKANRKLDQIIDLLKMLVRQNDERGACAPVGDDDPLDPDMWGTAIRRVMDSETVTQDVQHQPTL